MNALLAMLRRIRRALAQFWQTDTELKREQPNADAYRSHRQAMIDKECDQ